MYLLPFAPTPIGRILTGLLLFAMGGREEWNAFKDEHGKVYSGLAEEIYRFTIYQENVAYITKHNYLANLGHHSYYLKMNHLGDLLHTEYIAMNRFHMDERENKTLESAATFIAPEGYVTPTEVDWRTKGAVTGVKDQGQCGGCWAFSATGSLEGQHFRKTGELVSLSEQQLIDCTNNYDKFGEMGCNGGDMVNAFKYIHDNHGLDTESSYPYHAKDEICKFKQSTVGATDKGTVVIPENEKSLTSAVAAQGPISVGIDANHRSFQFYHHGIYHEPGCIEPNLCHGMLVVGYGRDYWLVKNSFGTKWGDNGYIKIARGEDDCGITLTASYPLV